MSRSVQSSQCGFLAVHTARPWSTNLWHSALPSDGGTMRLRSCSTFAGRVLLERPSLLESLIQCVSVTMAGLPYMSPKIRLALFLPTPGSFKSSSMVSGTW